MASSDTVYFTGEILLRRWVAKYVDTATKLPTSGVTLVALSKVTILVRIKNLAGFEFITHWF